MAAIAKRLKGGLGLLALALMVAACAPFAPAPEEPPDYMAWEAHQRDLAMLQAWSLDGRVALRTPDDAWSASLRWSQWVDYMDFRLRGTFGIGATRVRGDPGWVVIENSRGETWQTAEPERELALQTGWQVPLGMLRWWIIGLPYPDEEPAYLAVNGGGQLSELHQGGWTIEYDRYETVDGLALPGRITVDNELEGVTLRLRVSEWVLGDRTGGPDFAGVDSQQGAWAVIPGQDQPDE
ncbi:lipoprotein insertase outer membrane protein LolB [Gammaproteobacteria bacterium AB-CW1]|uniref:Outer-membrane lipoprotein LolB n=1 Tax=Natronospira elongata TaxID=3110268 RepID=A0AAP6MML3_9GAMM|nr:lipoprotein insertase outer membrane protein LolB [Gammaproteobacteria bacterium AB-CW1]